MAAMAVFWNEGATRPVLPPLTGDTTADVCVVGLGGSGLTAVREAQSRGMSVVGIDAGEVAAGAAGRNGGFLLAGIAAFHHDVAAQLGRDLAASLYQLTLDEMTRIDMTPASGLRRCGVVRAAVDEAEYEDCLAHRDALLADGFAADLYDGMQGRGILVPTDGVFHPVRRACALADAALLAGARLYGHTPATAVESGAVHTPTGTVQARWVLVAVDGGLARVVPALAGQVSDVRLQMVATAPSRAHLPHPVYSRHGYDYWQQHADGSVTIGGGRDVAGDSEWTANSEPTTAVTEYLRSVLDGIGVTEPLTHSWAATVGYTHNGMPVVREAEPGVWAVGGYCGTGNVVGALLARGVVELVDSGSSRAVTTFQAAALAD